MGFQRGYKNLKPHHPHQATVATMVGCRTRCVGTWCSQFLIEGNHKLHISKQASKLFKTHDSHYNLGVPGGSNPGREWFPAAQGRNSPEAQRTARQRCRGCAMRSNLRKRISWPSERANFSIAKMIKDSLNASTCSNCIEVTLWHRKVSFLLGSMSHNKLQFTTWLVVLQTCLPFAHFRIYGFQLTPGPSVCFMGNRWIPFNYPNRTG